MNLVCNAYLAGSYRVKWFVRMLSSRLLAIQAGKKLGARSSASTANTKSILK